MQLNLPGMQKSSANQDLDPAEIKKHLLKQDIVVHITEQLEGYLKKDIGQAVDIILETMVQSLLENRRVEIRGFGSFEVRQRKAKVSKNPKTEKIMNIPPRKTLHFTMSKSIKNPLIKK